MGRHLMLLDLLRLPPPTPTPTASPGAGPNSCDVLLGNPAAKMLCDTGKGAADALASVPGGVIDQLAQKFAESSDKVLTLMLTWWAQMPTGGLQAPLANSGGPVSFIAMHTHWYVTASAVLGLLVAAGRLAIQRRPEVAGRALMTVVAITVVSAAGATVVILLSQAGDSYSAWILQQASAGKGNWSDTFTKFTSLASPGSFITTQASGVPPAGMILFIALLGLISGLIQLVLMLIRSAMLGLLTGLLPLIASASGSESGRAAGRKAVSWLVAYLLYKPVAATIYAYAIAAMDTPNDEITKLSGFVMIILAVIALPALMRFVTPVVAAATSGGGAGAVAGAAAAVATGARMLPTMTGLRSGARGAPGAGPSGGAPAGSGRAPSGGVRGANGQRGASGRHGKTPAAETPAVAGSDKLVATSGAGQAGAGQGAVGAAKGAAGASRVAGGAAGAVAAPVTIAAETAKGAVRKVRSTTERELNDQGGPSGSV
ncbi:hypothetical protein ACWDRB_47555 [Nonomuraea sp. NPDC003707]